MRIRQSALDPYIEQLFWQEVDKLRRPARSRRITRLEQALAHREQELASYRDNPHLPRRLDPERFADGLAVRQRRADLARAELSRAKDAAQPAALPPTAELQARWQYMTTEERRDAISRVIDCVFVWHGRGEPANRICVLRRGDAPPGLPNVGEWKLETPPPFERSTAPAGIRLRATDDWSEEQIRDALENFVHDRAAWPTYEEFQAAGRGLLYEQADRHGGHRSWATTFRLPLTMVSTDGKKWTHERIRSGLAKVIRGRQQWPTWQEFQAADAQPLRFAVNATGGPAFWAREMDVELPAIQQPNCRPWTYMRMKAEAARFIGQRGEWPRAREFEAAGLDGLHQAICKRGLQARIAADLGIPAPPTRKLRVRRWTPEEIRAALDEFLRGRDTWPTPREFSAAGLAGLRTVLYRNDIAEHWAAQYGLTIRRYQPGAGL